MVPDNSKRNANISSDGIIGTAPRPQFQAPGHLDTMRACIASTVSSVIDCFSRESLRGPAEDVLSACAGGQVIGVVSYQLFLPQRLTAPTLVVKQGLARMCGINVPGLLVVDAPR